MSRWSKWWFLNGGGIHRAVKHEQIQLLEIYARDLPKAAWDEQQLYINTIFDAIKRGDEKWLKKEADDHFAEKAGDG